MIYLQLFWTFLKVGAFTFGGGYAMLPLIQEEVSTHGWMDMESLVNFIAVSESTPGPFAVNISTYVGYETGGIFGSICATIGVVLPSLIIIMIIAKVYLKFKENFVVNSCMTGLRPAVIGLIGAAVISVGSTLFTGLIVDNRMQVIPLVSTIIIFFIVMGLQYKKLHPIIIIAASAVLGVVAGMAGWL